MKFLTYLIGLPIAVGFTFYFRAFFRRMLNAFGVDVTKKGVKIGLWIAGALVGVFCLKLTGVGTIVVAHVFLLAVLFQFVNFLVRKIARKRYERGCSVWKKIYGSGFVPIVLSAAILIGGYINMNHVVGTFYTVYTEKEIREEGYRVALVADTHFGVSVDSEELKRICERIERKEPDLVVLCGDIVDDSTTKKQMHEVFAALGSIESEFGTFFVYGNHDRPRSYGIDYEFTAAELVETIESNGITVLQDEIIQVTDDLVIVGREDRSAETDGKKRLSVDELLSAVDPTDFVLTLDHQPHEYKENGRAGTDLLLSGHTHGGQLFPLQYVQLLFRMNDAVYGKTKLSNDGMAIVTSGLAAWNYPFKTAAPAEYVIVDIQRK